MASSTVTELHEDIDISIQDGYQSDWNNLLVQLSVRTRGEEDFITDVFCWLLKHTGFGKQFLEILRGIGVAWIDEFESGCSWQTQKTYRLDQTDKRLDMVCLSNDGKFALIFEHKVLASIDKQQLANYEQIANERFDNNWNLILITARENPQDQNSYKHLLWREIYEWLSKWHNDCVEEIPRFVTSNFLRLLDTRGLGPMDEITGDQLRAIPVAREGEQRIKTLIHRVAEHPKWEELKDGADNGRERGFAWGRSGIYLIGAHNAGTWNPAVFIGVMHNGNDHGPASVNHQQGPGPIACLIVDVHSRYHGDYENSEPYSTLVDALRRFWRSDSTDGWRIYECKRNLWHPLTIYKPLESIFRTTETGEDQVDAFVNELHKVANVVLKLDEFVRFREFLVEAPANRKS